MGLNYRDYLRIVRFGLSNYFCESEIAKWEINASIKICVFVLNILTPKLSL